MPLRLLDSTLISLTLSVYDWAHYTTANGAVKMHTLLDYDCLLPEFVNITDGKGSDNKAAYDIPVNPHSIVAADRGYCDYGLLKHWDSNKVFFVVRHKDNIRYKTVRERPLPERQAQNVLIDEEIELELPAAKKKYPKKLRRIAVWNDEHGFTVELLTNNFTLAASTIAAIYKARWPISLCRCALTHSPKSTSTNGSTNRLRLLPRSLLLHRGIKTEPFSQRPTSLQVDARSKII